MSQSSEERVPPSAIDAQEPAQILPFERPLSELQRSIQWRAQTANDVQREREREAKRPRPLKWLIIFLLALVPVVMIFGALDAFLRVYYRLTEQYLSAPATVEQSLPATPEPPQSEAGVVMLRPYEVSPVGSPASAPAASPAAGSKPASGSPESGAVAPSQSHRAARPGDRSNRSAEETAAGRQDRPAEDLQH